jgi:hypothetical protein
MTIRTPDCWTAALEKDDDFEFREMEPLKFIYPLTPYFTLTHLTFIIPPTALNIGKLFSSSEDTTLPKKWIFSSEENCRKVVIPFLI